MVRLLEAAAAGLTNIALLSEEVLIISNKLLLRGTFCSCREVQRQTKVCESAVGGCAHIRFAVIYAERCFIHVSCKKIFHIFHAPTLYTDTTLGALCYVTRSGKSVSLLQF